MGCSTIEKVKQSTVHEKKVNDDSQYTKKTWLLKNHFDEIPGSGYMSIRIINMDNNGQITGILNSEGFNEVSHEVLDAEYEFKGTLLHGIAECKFKTYKGNIGIMNLLFSSEDKLQATFSSISQKESAIISPEIIFELEPDNINKMKNFRVVENQSFMVDLDSWGDVRFIVGELLGGSYGPVLCIYLTNEAGDILYDFFDMYASTTNDSELYSAKHINDVSFEDINGDGLKDFVIIATIGKEKKA
jgi:hypothetical protein